jgi:outer membrane protein assembly factor BamB
MQKSKPSLVLALLLAISMSASMILIPNTTAHSPPWQIPTYAKITAAPSPIGVGQTAHVYMWLDPVYGGAAGPIAGGTLPANPANGSTASAALLSNNWRFKNYNLTTIAPDGTVSNQVFATISDPTSSQYVTFTPDQVGTYTFMFNYPGQVYGADGNGYEKSVLFGDMYLPSNATTTLVVQQDPIPSAITSYPLPAEYWSRPIYGENTDWWQISSNWLGYNSPPVGGWSSAGGYGWMYHQDGQGPLTNHIMWTRPLQFGGVVGGNQFGPGGSDPNSDAYGVAYFEGSSYAPRFFYPIIVQGILYYTETASFTGSPIMGGSSTGPTRAIDLRTGEEIWSNPNIPQLSWAYIYNLWNPDQHGVYPAVLVAQVTVAPGTVVPLGASLPAGAAGSSQWNLYDAARGDPLFNVTAIPAGTTVMGPSGEPLKYNLYNAGTSANPIYYLSQWNMSRLWQYDINPYTGSGSLSPSIINATNGALVVQLPVPITGESVTMPPNQIDPVSGNYFRYTPGNPGLTNNTMWAPYGSTLIVNASVPLTPETSGATGKYPQSISTYDWNISLPTSLNSMTGANAPVIVAANYGDMLLCRSGSLPAGFAASGTGQPQTPYTFFGINLNASRGSVGSIMWTKTYNPPPGNTSLIQEPVDFQTRVFTFTLQDTMQWVGYDLDTGNQLWGPTASQAAFDYYGNPGTVTLAGVIAYGNIYVSSFSGILYCYNDRTGELLWTYGNGGPGNSTNAGFNVFYGAYPTQIQSISNGVVYTATDEHTVPNPIYKGATYRAINATTGAEIWVLSGYPSEWATAGTAWATADGYLTCMNGYDQQIYSIGRGPSALTVTAPDLSAAMGQPVVIKGTVIDVSAGTKQSQQAARFPNGVPVASDKSMQDWMGYIYQQRPFPTNFTGVQVTIDVVDANGNYRNIGTATTDYTGAYSLVWTPDIPGAYNVVATFHGTNGYWPSTATTAFNVMETQATATPTTGTAAPSLADLYILPIGIAILIAVIVVGIAIMAMLRRRA